MRSHADAFNSITWASNPATCSSVEVRALRQLEGLNDSEVAPTDPIEGPLS
jgi:hypothetical protein